MPLCPNCDAVLPEGYETCPVCSASVPKESGARVPAKGRVGAAVPRSGTKTCPECKAINPAMAWDCFECGARLPVLTDAEKLPAQPTLDPRVVGLAAAAVIILLILIVVKLLT